MEVLKNVNKNKGNSKKTTSSTTFLELIPYNNMHALGPSFYKIIVASSTQSYKLKIPEKYVKMYYEEQLANDYVKLKVNDGRVWIVELFKEDGKVWLSKGWECLVEKYSLKYGNFLLFRYDMVNFEYHVTIFDMTCLEIDYDRMFDNHTNSQQVIKILSQHDEDVGQDNINHDYGVILEAEGGVVGDENASVIGSLEAFKSENPHFKVVMNCRNMKLLIKKHLKLVVPNDYAKVFFKDKNRRDLILKGPNDEKSYKLKSYYYKLKSSANIFGFEWRTFVRDNKVRVGDTCVFELVDLNSNTYKATIIRGLNH